MNEGEGLFSRFINRFRAVKAKEADSTPEDTSAVDAYHKMIEIAIRSKETGEPSNRPNVPEKRVALPSRPDMTEEEKAHLQMQRRGNSRSSFPSDLDLALDALLEIAYPNSESEREKVDLAMEAMAEKVKGLAPDDPKRENLVYAEGLVKKTIETFKAVQESGRLSPRDNSIPANYGRRPQKSPRLRKVSS